MSLDTCEHGNPRGTCDVTPHRCAIERISLRDEIAMRAMASMLSIPGIRLSKEAEDNDFFDAVAQDSYNYADAMLKARGS